MSEAAPENFILHRAAWLAPISRPPVADGAVLVKGSTILDAGPYSLVRHRCPAGVRIVDHGSVALMPALVNAHTHLELSALKGQIALPQQGFPKWVEALFALRATLTPQAQRQGMQKAFQQLHAGATVLVGDIANGIGLEQDAVLFPFRQVFWEVLGFNVQDLEAVPKPEGLCTGGDGSLPVSLAAHSCYSTSPELIRQVKSWTRERSLPFSIHAAEHPEEMQFLAEGSGYCRDLLERLGRWDARWTPPRTTPIRYLDRLGVLDSRTLLVHAVHATEDDWEIIRQRGCSVCFCPRSNRHLSVGKPDVARAVRLGIPAALGTDSLAGNTDLNLFAEAAEALDLDPTVPAEAVLQMITLGGAVALQQGHRFGSLDPGKYAGVLSVALPQTLSASWLAEAILDSGNKGAWQWAHCPTGICT